MFSARRYAFRQRRRLTSRVPDVWRAMALSGRNNPPHAGNANRCTAPSRAKEVNMKCANCEKELTSKMEIEYSAHITEYYCSPDCATDRYFNYLESTSIDFSNLPDGLKIVKGKLKAVEHLRAVDAAPVSVLEKQYCLGLAPQTQSPLGRRLNEIHKQRSRRKNSVCNMQCVTIFARQKRFEKVD